MSTPSFRLLISIILILFSNVSNAEEKLRQFAFLVNTDNLEDYKALLNGHHANEVNDFSLQGLNRHSMELLIFQIAPVIGGCNCEVIYKPSSVVTPHARAITEVKNGRRLSHPIAGMSSDSRLEGLQLSEPILIGEDFWVGLYTHEKRRDILKLTDIDTIKSLRFSASVHWEVDKNIIKDNGFKLVEADLWSALIQLIINNKADILLQPFSDAADFSFVDNKTQEKFIPIPGVKFQFGKSRQYFVSKVHPEGEDFLGYLNKGILELTQSGRLRQLQIQSGVVNTRVDSWYDIK